MTLNRNDRFFRPARERRTGDRPAFTLVEIMIAVVIFGIGLTMVAGLFPAALTLNKSSTSDVIGNIVCENALSIAQAQLTHQEVQDRGIDRDALTPLNDLIGERDRMYALLDGNTQTTIGWLLLGRQVGEDPEDNEYLLVAVSYRMRDSGNEVRVRDFSINIEDYEGVSIADFGGSLPSEVQPNGAIIFDDGRYAFITGIGDGGRAVLDRRLPKENNRDVWVPYEQPQGRNSPVMAVMTTRTALSTD